MRKGLAILLACAASVLSAPAESRFHILSTTVVPARPYVGDVVECSVTFDAGSAALEEGPLAPPPMGTDPDVELVDAGLRRKAGAWVYTARFIAWVPGPAAVPGAGFAEGAIGDVLVDIASALEDFGRSPPRFGDPLELKGTRLLVWSLAGSVLAAAVLAGSLAFGFLPWMKRMRKLWREGRAGRDFAGFLDYLDTTAADLSAEDVWALLSSALRRYLGERTHCPYPALTAREAASAAPENLPADAASEAAAILAEGEAVRFARARPGGNPAAAITRARALMARVEEDFRDGLR